MDLMGEFDAETQVDNSQNLEKMFYCFSASSKI